jgi:hypothetical protein
VWTGAIRTKKEPSTGALVVAAISNALMASGTQLLETQREDRRTAGIVLTGIGAAGVLASDALPGAKREELRLEQIAPKR